MIERAHALVAREELYAVDRHPDDADQHGLPAAGRRAARPRWRRRERIALVPDLFNLWLTGELANESTAASTTGLLDARAGTWARELVERLGLPAPPFAGDPVEPGTTLGPVLAHHEGVAARTGARRGRPRHRVRVRRRPAAHAQRRDPLARARGRCSASSSTRRVLDARAAGYNLTNERGVDGTIRLLRNVMGLWLLQECRRAWDGAGLRRAEPARRRRAGPTCRCSTPTTTRSSPPATCPRGSPAPAAPPASPRRRARARSCARSSPRWPASTASCSSAWSASAAARSRSST